MVVTADKVYNIVNLLIVYSCGGGKASEMTLYGANRTEPGEPLGGRGTVRVGNTVRRQSQSSTRPVHALLEHLKTVGFGAVPDVLGIDDDGREVLSWVDGQAGVEPIAPDVSSDEALIAVARLIRRFHDATTTFQWERGGWDSLLADPSGSSEIICHNDLSTHNIVYQRTNPVAIIDWEFASPGSRLWDLAYACVWLVPLHAPEHCIDAGWGILDQARRLRLFCDSYGLGSARDTLLGVIDERLARNLEQLDLWVAQGLIDPAPSGTWREAADVAHIARYRSVFKEVLA